MRLTHRCPSGTRYRKTYVRKGTRIAGKCLKSQTRRVESSASFRTRVTGRMTKRFRGVRHSARSGPACGKGHISRKAFVRYSTSGKRTLVRQGCVRNMGRPGKGLSLTTGGPGIGPLHKGELAQFGYEKVTSLSVSQRREALRKAVHIYGSLSVWRKLNAVHVYTRSMSPASSRVFKEDRDWVKTTFGIKAF
jgi:hypothetical protein